MLKGRNRVIGVAIIIGALATGALVYLGQDDDQISSVPVVQSGRRTKTPPVVSEPPVAVTENSVNTPETVTAAPVAEPEAPLDEYSKHQEILVNEFKDKIKLNIALPSDMNFEELDLDADEVAAMQGTANGKKMAILASPKSGSPQAVAGFLLEQKKRIPQLNNHDFKISGDLKTIPGPKNSGISKITIIPGGDNNGYLVYAAHLERSDKKGSYVLIMEGSPAYFEKYEGDLDNMLSSLSTK